PAVDETAFFRCVQVDPSTESRAKGSTNPSASGSGSGGTQSDFTALNVRMEFFANWPNFVRSPEQPPMPGHMIRQSLPEQWSEPQLWPSSCAVSAVRATRLGLNSDCERPYA